MNTSITTAIRTGAKTLGRTLNQQSPTILTALGVTGLITTTVLAVKATPKAMLLLEEERDRRIKSWVRGTGEDPSAYPIDPVLKPIDMVKTTWRCYLPAAVAGLATIGCMVGANTIHLRRTAALAAVYSITADTLREYQAKVVDQIGANKEQKVRDAIATDRLAAHPVGNSRIVATGRGDKLCFDPLSGRLFYSDVESIHRAQNDFNYRLMTDVWLPVNELYDDLGLAPTEAGRLMGWDINEGQLDIGISSKVTDTGDPCIVLVYKQSPHLC